MSVYKILMRVDNNRDSTPLTPVNSDNIKWVFDNPLGTIAVDFIEGLPGIEHNNLLGLTTGNPHTQYALAGSGVTDHGLLTGLADDDHIQYALLAGRSGGQTLKGDTASGGNLTLNSTAHATKGSIFFGSLSFYDEANALLSIIGTTNPTISVQDTTNNAIAYLKALNTSGEVGTSSGHNFSLVRAGIIRATFDSSNVTFISDIGSTATGVLVSNTASGGLPFIQLDGPSRSYKFQIETGTFLRLYDVTAGGSARLAVSSAGNIAIGGSTPDAFGILDVQSTTAAFIPPRMTTAQRDAMTPVNGMILYNTTTAKFQGYEAGAWANLI